MLKKLTSVLLLTPLAWACGSSFPEPKQPLADAESASRSAREVGADSQPSAKLEVKLADEQIAKAKGEIADGHNQRASYTLLRAKADAELALALAREQNALVDKQKASDKASTALTANTGAAQ